MAQTVNQEERMLLRVDEAARMLGVDPRTVKRYASSGQLPRVALTSRTTRYRREDVEALIEASLEGGR